MDVADQCLETLQDCDILLRGLRYYHAYIRISHLALKRVGVVTFYEDHVQCYRRIRSTFGATNNMSKYRTVFEKKQTYNPRKDRWCEKIKPIRKIFFFFIKVHR